MPLERGLKFLGFASTTAPGWVVIGEDMFAERIDLGQKGRPVFLGP